LAKHHRYTADDITVSWGPLYHDMGLVVGVLMPIVSGASAVLIPPSYWVRSPKSLLWAIHNYGATVTWIPNFALNHTVRSVRDRDLDGLDLSSCRIFGAAAEPVRLDSLEMFAERFEKYGFRREALMAGYGLAENVVGVSCTSLERAPEVDWVSVQDLQQADRAVPVLPYSEGARPIVSCGHPLNGTEIRVVDESGDNLPDRYAGEVVIRSNSLFTGYFRRPDLTTGAIRNGWLHTGDIGYLVDGQLYICGRKKDLIIVGGMNIYPADVEEIANRNPNLRPGRAVAIGLPNDRLGTEDLVLICELRPEVAAETYDDIARELRFRVVQELNVALADVRFVDRGWVLKTTSGKLARTRNQQKYLGAFRQ
jgi:fatty-acyl-CoA synthase